ncbi:MAG: PEP-CTERM sorting domain-containing protein, partial [Phycisphaerae bacterium]
DSQVLGWRGAIACAGALLIGLGSAFPVCASAAGGHLARLVASDGVAGNEFGDSVAVGREWLVVGAPGRDDAGRDCGAAYVFGRTGAAWVEWSKLTASDAAGGDRFGGSVAIGLDTIVVGARDYDGAGEGSGSAYVFTWDGLEWVERTRLVASDADEGDSFGCSVAVSGETVAVGAYARDGAGESSGAVYVFQRDGAAWYEQARLTAGDARQGQYFGCSVSVDGDRMVVGARGDDDRGANAGAVYLFTRQGEQWTETAKCIGSGVAQGDYFGRIVAVSGDRFVASALGDEPSGAAYVFQHDGGEWTESGVLTVPGAAEGDAFGCHVAMDGEDVVVGARGDRDDSGAAYVFTRDGEAWREVSKLTAAEDPGGRLGWSVAISDGCVVAGAVGEIGKLSTGSAHVFAAGTRTAWRAEQASPALWSDPNNWTAGVPDGDTDVTIEHTVAARVCSQDASAKAVAVGVAAPGTLRIEHATLGLWDLCIGPNGVVTADANGTIRLGGGFENHITDAGSFDLSEATVVFGLPKSPGEPELLEVAGRDLGLDPAGWDRNFAVGSLVVDGGAILRLVDEFDNDPNGPGAEALYVDELRIEQGGGIDLNGLHLYYLNGGPARRLMWGDCDLDGDVDRSDFRVFRESFGTGGPAGWTDGDSDGDGDVDALDYLAIKSNLGVTARAEPAETPEPGTLLLLAAGAGILLRSRRRPALAAGRTSRL